MSTKRWKELRFMNQVVIKPEDPKQPMWVEFKDDSEFEYNPWYEGREMLVSRDRSIRLGANCMYSIEMDYPEDFKKLVSATGDCDEAYRLYQALQKPAPANWSDYDTEAGVWN